MTVTDNLPPSAYGVRGPASSGEVRRFPAVAVIIATYAIAWWPMLLNGGRYWDDWCAVRLSPAGASLMADQLGQIWQRYYWLALSWWPGAEYIFHAVTFGLFLASAVLLYGLLRRVPGLDPSVAVLAPVVFGVFPVNAARFVQMNLQYSLSLAIFYLAWYLIALDLDRPRLARRLVSAVLLAAAMVTMNSLLVFSVLVPGYVVWMRWGDLQDHVVRRELILRYGFLLLLPVAVFAFRSVALRPWGLYQEYNSVTLVSLIAALRMLPAAVRESFFEPLLLGMWWLPLAAPIYLLLRRRGGEDDPSPRHDTTVFVIGAAAFFLGVFPYLAVGKLPQATGFAWDLWDSRHQVLVPLGSALMLYGGLALIGRVVGLKRTAALSVVAALVVGFVVADLGISLDYQADWYKQVSVMTHMDESADVRAANFLVVRDDATALNVVGRRYLPYELSGMMYTVFGDATRFGVDEALLDPYVGQLGAYKEHEQYHWWAYEDPPRGYRITITPGAVDVSEPGVVLDLMWRQGLDREGFDRRVRDIIKFETAPVDVTGG